MIVKNNSEPSEIAIRFHEEKNNKNGKPESSFFSSSGGNSAAGWMTFPRFLSWASPVYDSRVSRRLLGCADRSAFNFMSIRHHMIPFETMDEHQQSSRASIECKEHRSLDWLCSSEHHPINRAYIVSNVWID